MGSNVIWVTWLRRALVRVSVIARRGATKQSSVRPRSTLACHARRRHPRVRGKFDDATRAVISRWQAARGYPKTGFINSLQLRALQSEIVSTRVASADDGDDEPARRSRRSSGGGGRHYRGGGGGPGAFFGGMMGGLFGRR